MSTSVTSFDELDPEAVVTNEQLLIQILNEFSKELDLSDGTALRQMLVRTNAILDTINKEDIERLRQSQSLLAINENPDLADPELVDRVLSNYLTTRRVATTVSGRISVFQETETALSIPESTIFTDPNGRTFSPTSSILGVPDANFTGASNEQLIRVSPRGFYFVVDVIESVAGGSFISGGTAFDIDITVGGITETLATEDFTAALENETNEDLIARLDAGIAAKAMSDRTNIEALIREAFDSVIDMSITGFGDFEMRRDKHNILGVANGGKADLYTRTSPDPIIFRLTVFGRAQAVDNDGIIYRVTLTPSAAGGASTVPAGFYRVEEVRHAVGGSTFSGTGGAAPLAFEEDKNREVLVVNEPFSPFIGDFREAVYSRYQGATQVSITDPLSDTQYRQAFDDTFEDGVRRYDIFVSYIPQMFAIHEFINTRLQRNPSADYMVRAPIPMFVTTEMTVEYVENEGAPDILPIQEAVKDAINTTQMVEQRLQASVLTTAATSVLTTNQRVVLPIVMRGELRLPGGDIVFSASASALEIEDNIDEGVSTRNTAFFATAPGVDITLVAVNNLEI